METPRFAIQSWLHHSGSYPTYEEWKLDEFYEFSKQEGRVLILPMRNGNLSAKTEIITNLSSYPTYEEWKLFSEAQPIVHSMLCSYPTYEEWKLALISNLSATSSLFLSYL